MSIGHAIGRLAADVVGFFRDKPFVPCQVDWDYHERMVVAQFPTDAQRRLVEDRRDDLAFHAEGDCFTVDTLGAARDWWNGYRA
jgi:hypothetical protein